MNWRDRLFIRVRPRPENVYPATRDCALEALRGICALLVFIAHGFISAPAVDPVYAPSESLWCINLGLPAVLMFFVLSGYVIGLTTRKPLERKAVVRYLSRRVTRLLPVTYIAILLAWLFLPNTGLHTILGNAFFLQNTEAYPWTGWHFPLLENNGALWTLNYEAFYYLSFIVIWWRAPSLILVVSLVALFPIGRAAGLPFPSIIVRYACGASYWLTGLCVAWLTVPPPMESRRGHWPSALLTAYAIWQLGELKTFIYDMKLFSLLDWTVVSLHRLDFLPVSAWCLLSITGRMPTLERKLAIGCLLWGWIGFVRTIFLEEATELMIAVTGVTLLAASFLIKWKPPQTALNRLAPLGAVSFGLYALASPIQIAQRHLFPEFSGTPLTFFTRLIFIFILTLGLAWIVDCRLNRTLSAHLKK